MTIFGYARDDTDEPTLDAQVGALTVAGAVRVFCEPVSGARADRRELANAVNALRDGDTLLVTRIERLARSTRDLVNTLETISKIGAGFRSIAEAWADTTRPRGRLTPTVIKGLAEFERDLLRARTGEGRVRAKARGQHMGRPPILTLRQREQAISALAAGTSTQADLARQLNVSQSTISRLAEKGAFATPKPGLDSETYRAVRSFMRRLDGLYRVGEAIIYGSRARQTHRPDSDADIAVVLEGEHGDRSAVVRDMAGIAFHVMMETGVMVEAIPIWRDEFERPETFRNPRLIENIRREGLRL